MLAVALLGLGANPIRGPWRTAHFAADSPRFDPSDQMVDVWYPTDMPEAPRFISYAHGMGGGGALLLPGYAPLLSAVASWGYVIAAPRACNVGCREDRRSLPRDPPNFGNYYKQQLLAIEEARRAHRAGEPIFARINFTGGVGIAGHSMGGQATVFSAARELAREHEIRAAVMHNAYTHVFPRVDVPSLIFTGTEDDTATPLMSEELYGNLTSGLPAGLANKEGTGHHAPDLLGYDPLIAQFTAAWFKLHLDGVSSQYGHDFAEMIQGRGAESLCGGGFGRMASCETRV